MTRRMKVFLVVLLFSFITSCGGARKIDQLSARQSSLKSRADYNSYLALEYLEFSKNLIKANQQKVAEHFIDKGLAVANGQNVVPENPLVWGADSLQMEEFVMMQKRLEAVLNTPQLKNEMPIQLAHLTYLYDCFASREVKEVFKVSNLAQCKSKFKILLEEIENYIDNPKQEPKPEVVIKEPQFEYYEVFFAFNSGQLNNKGEADIIKILDYLSSLKTDYKVLVVGKADRVGDNLYNKNLALRRAKLVRDYLVNNGITESIVQFRSLGEDLPDIITKDGAREPENRAVVVYILKGQDSFDNYPVPLLNNKIYEKKVIKERNKRGLES